VRLLGVSGPDGSGKTTLVSALRAEAERRGVRVVSMHPYGCVICRRWPVSANGASVDDVHSLSGLSTVIQRLHVFLDAAELSLRIHLARGWLANAGAAHLVPAGAPALVVTDRSPLDALAKHYTHASPAAGRWLLRLARGYDLIVVLDADPKRLAARDRDHLHNAEELALLRGRFRSLIPLIASMRKVDTTVPVSARVVDDVLVTLTGEPR
jgi:hypothetical protein